MAVLHARFWLLTCLTPTAEPVSLATGAHCLTREKSKVKFTCVLVVKVKAQDYCEQPLWGA